ncbi:MAG: alpha/beta fold hydrolase [Promethearchaeota archaeon]
MVIKKFKLGEVTIESMIDGDVNGEPIILIPGNGAEVSLLNLISVELNNAGFKTIGLNMRGVSGSKGPIENITMHDLAGDIAGVIESLGCIPVHVLGWAFGSRIVRCLASDRPNLIKTVTLLCAAGKVAPSAETWKIFSKTFTRETPKEEYIESLIFSFFSPSTPRELALRALRLSGNWPEAKKANRYAGKNTAVEEWWDSGKSDLLIIQGLDDRIAPPENGRIYKEEFGDRITLIEIEKAGHFLIQEQPQVISKAIVSYLRENVIS